MIVIVRKNGGDVEEVAEAADSESESETKSVGDTATEEANSSKGRVQGGIGVVNVGCAQLTTGAQAVDGVEHAWAQEAHQGDEDDLKLWRRIGRDVEGTEFDRFVHPWLPSLVRAPNCR